VRLALGRVRDEVLKKTGNRQEPFVYGSLGGAEMALVSGKAVETAKATAAQGQSEAERAWAVVKDSTSVAALEAFIRRFGDTFYGDLAKARLTELTQQVDATRQAMKKKAEDDARAKAEADRQRLALLAKQEEENRRQVEARTKEAEARKQASQGVNQFDGKWQVEWIGNHHCTGSAHRLEEWTIANGSVKGRAGVRGEGRGTVTTEGEVNFSWPHPDRTDRVYAFRAQLRGATGRGTFRSVVTNCAGRITLKRL
jgi:hypothetical protein